MNKKELQAITEIKDNKLTAIASTEDVDRSGDSLKVKDWDFSNFKANPVLQAGHDYRPEFTVGVAKNLRIKGKEILFEPVFHNITQLAREIGEMYKEKILKAWSVGFIPASEEGQKHELLEVSAVAIPANAKALMKGLKDNTKITKEIEEYIKKEIIEKDKEKIEIKSPGCRKEDETKDECVSRKIPELIDEGMEQDQAIATANSICETKCSEKGIEEEETDEDIEEKKKVETKEDIQQETGDTDGHTHLAQFDDETGNGKTSVVNDHFHQIANSLVLEENGHTHTLEVEKSKKKPKKGLEKKELWNKQLPDVFKKDFDIESYGSQPSSELYKIYTKYLGCKVKNIYLNSFTIPSPLLGSYLKGFDENLKDLKLVDERNFSYFGGENPLVYETIQLNSTKSEDFLIKGTRFYKEGDRKFVIEFDPGWAGLNVSIVSEKSNKIKCVEFFDSVNKWVDENNLLKGEIFGLSGEFISKTKDSWEDIILDDNVENSIKKSFNSLKTKGIDSLKRGLMFVGPPGTGKTKACKIAMNDLEDVTYIWVSSKDFANMSTIGALKLAFDLSRKLAPSILCMEDIDKWLKDYAIDLLKTEMDGLSESKGTITILTSNNPEEFPDALLDRPGRFHDVLEFDLPDTKRRAKMVEIFAGEIDSKLLATIVKRTEGYSGAHLKELVDFAQLIIEDDGIKMGEALLQSLDKLEKQKELVERIKDDRPKKNEIKSIEIKESRVLSTKSRKIIKSAIEANEKATEELGKLVELTEKDKVEEPITELPKKEITKLEMEQLISKRILQKINKLTNNGLREIKK